MIGGESPEILCFVFVVKISPGGNCLKLNETLANKRSAKMMLSGRISTRPRMQINRKVTFDTVFLPRPAQSYDKTYV